MKIEVVHYVGNSLNSKILGKVCVVIDVLRATSVICTALNMGAKSIIPVLEVTQAQALKLSDPEMILAGERNGFKVTGFDLGNSPLQFTADVVADKDIILTTTNGTKATLACQGACKVFAGSFLNVQSLVKVLLLLNKDIVLVCSGTDGNFSLDDGLCAGAIITEISNYSQVDIDDYELGLTVLFRYSKKDLHTTLSECKHYLRLESIGYKSDLEYCLNMNTLKVVPVFKEGRYITENPAESRM